MPVFTETDDYTGLIDLFDRCGLEVTIGEVPPAGLVKCWEITDGGIRIAGAVLEIRAGEFVLAEMAVEPEFRRQKLGTQLLDIIIAEVRVLRGKRLLLTAKVPGFYAARGFSPVERASAPPISSCLTCAQYRVRCFPEIMCLDLS